MLALSLMGYSVSAQNDDKDGRPDRDDRRENNNRINPRLLDQLSLTATQSEQIKIINDDYRTKMQDMIKTDLSVDERKAKRNVYDAERKAKFLAVLTPAQTQKLLKIQKSEKMDQSKDEDYKIKTKTEDGEKTKIKVKTDKD